MAKKDEEDHRACGFATCTCLEFGDLENDTIAHGQDVISQLGLTADY